MHSRIPQTSDAKLNYDFNIDRANFYDFPFFSHRLSETNNIPFFPIMNPPVLNLYTPTGLFTNYPKNENISNSQSDYY